MEEKAKRADELSNKFAEKLKLKTKTKDVLFKAKENGKGGYPFVDSMVSLDVSSK